MIALTDTSAALDSGTGMSGTPQVPAADLELLLRQMEPDLTPRYRLDGYLGRGAFATVWKAEDRVTGETVAIKRFHARIPENRNFYRELSALFRLRHERIVRIINLQEVADRARYLILEYCGGGTLRTALNKGHRAGLVGAAPRVRALALQLAEGLAAAHRLGLVHRDLKPENILFERQADEASGGSVSVKIVDFGLARALYTGPAVSGSLRPLSGSPAYMAPEQFNNTFSPGSDIYALGVILYELLTGQPPYSGTSEELAYQHLHSSAALAALPGAWPDLLGAMLAKDAAARPGAEEVIEALGQRQLDQRSHPARCGGRFVRLRLPAAHLLNERHGNRDLLAVTPTGIQRFRADTGALLDVLPVANATHAICTDDGTLWVSQPNRVVTVRGKEQSVERMLVPTGVEAMAAKGAGLQTHFAVVTQGTLRSYDVSGPTLRYSVPVRVSGLRPAIAWLADGELAYVEGPLHPRLVVVDHTGKQQRSTALPGPCWDLMDWPGTPWLVALVLCNNRLCGIRVDRDCGEVLELPGAEDLACALALDQVEPALFGITPGGTIWRWHSAQADQLLQVPIADCCVRGFTTDGTHAGILFQGRGSSWIQLIEFASGSLKEFEPHEA